MASLGGKELINAIVFPPVSIWKDNDIFQSVNRKLLVVLICVLNFAVQELALKPMIKYTFQNSVKKRNIENIIESKDMEYQLLMQKNESLEKENESLKESLGKEKESWGKEKESLGKENESLKMQIQRLKQKN